HAFIVVTALTQEGRVYYLIDTTLRQYFWFENNGERVRAGSHFMKLDINITERLLRDGFVVFDDYVADIYGKVFGLTDGEIALNRHAFFTGGYGFNYQYPDDSFTMDFEEYTPFIARERNIRIQSYVRGQGVVLGNLSVGSSPVGRGNSSINNVVGIDGSTVSLLASTSKTGGIDFRALPIVTQAMSNLSLNVSRISLSSLDGINLNKE
ncbi:MAG: hypothetical protein WCL25_05835, partial [bacterium]